MPGESPAVFGDALRRLAAEATYLYQDGNRFWYSTQPTVTRLAEDRSAQLAREPEKVAREIERRVREEVRQRPGEFSRVHEFPRGSQDVPDDLDVRLVILGIDRPHIRGQESPALAFAKEILEWRGSSPRHYRNTLVFLAPDQSRLQDLEESVRRYLAWESILQDTDLLNLSPQQVRQAEEQKRTANATVNAQLPETYLWLLVPIQTDPHGNISWQEIRLQGNDGLAVRASSRLLKDELLITRLAGTRLRMELDKVPLWRGDHVPVTQLIEDFARYIYLSRLKNPAVLVEAIRDGVALTTWEKDTFAYAESFDEDTGRYRGLRAGQVVSLSPEAPQGLVIKPDVAQMQLATETPQPPTGTGSNVGKPPGPVPVPTPVPPPPPPVKLPTRFHGTVTLDPIRAGAEAGKIVQEILTHLINLPGAQVQVTLEIDTRVPGGIPENVVCIVTENAKTLRFTNHGFEPD